MQEGTDDVLEGEHEQNGGCERHTPPCTEIDFEEMKLDKNNKESKRENKDRKSEDIQLV